MMKDENGKRFFITHAHADNAFAQRFADDLRRLGLDGFFDIYSIRPGDNIPANINKGLAECDIYVPILSNAALDSPWCEEEITAALTLSNRRDRHGRPRIIPVLIEDCQSRISQQYPTLQTRLYISFVGRYDEALQELRTRGFGLPLGDEISDPTIEPVKNGKYGIYLKKIFDWVAKNILVAGTLFFISVVLLMFLAIKIFSPVSQGQVPISAIIPATTTSTTPEITPNVISTEVSTQSLTSDACKYLKSRIYVGAKVYSENNLVKNLNIRKIPGLSAPIVTSVVNGTEFIVLDGPVCMDGIMWWEMSTINGASRGWVAEVNNSGIYYVEP